MVLDICNRNFPLEKNFKFIIFKIKLSEIIIKQIQFSIITYILCMFQEYGVLRKNKINIIFLISNKDIVLSEFQDFD